MLFLPTFSELSPSEVQFPLGAGKVQYASSIEAGLRYFREGTFRL